MTSSVTMVDSGPYIIPMEVYDSLQPHNIKEISQQYPILGHCIPHIVEFERGFSWIVYDESGLALTMSQSYGEAVRHLIGYCASIEGIFIFDEVFVKRIMRDMKLLRHIRDKVDLDILVCLNGCPSELTKTVSTALRASLETAILRRSLEKETRSHQ